MFSSYVKRTRAYLRPPASAIQTALGLVEYASYGQGPAVIALHGGMGGLDQSLMLAKAAVSAPDYRIIAVSRPGYHGTPLASGKTPEMQAGLCAALLDKLGIEKAAVIAISAGGLCALQFAFAIRGAAGGW